MDVDRNLPPSIRHGSVSTARGPRFAEAASRDINMGHSQPPQFVRTIPAGQQENLDFLEALEDVTDRLDTIERNHRMLAQTVATEVESSKTTRSLAQ